MWFKDEILDEKFSEEGYVIVDWVDMISVQKLNQFCIEKGLDKIDGFGNSMNYSDIGVSYESNEIIEKIFSPSISMYFNDVLSPVVGSFVVKGKGKHGKISLHQDWNIVDEKKSLSINIWCALEKTTFKNGCMAVLPKSHKQPDSIRGSLVNNIWSEANPNNIFNYWLSNYKIKYIFLNPGQALIYNQKLVHFSTENYCKKSRVAVGLVVVPKDQPLIHYKFEMTNQSIIKFKIDQSFFYDKSILEFDTKKYQELERIVLKKDIDRVFDQVHNSVFPDEKGILNVIKRKFIKFTNL